MQTIKLFLSVVVLQLMPSLSAAQSSTINAMRFWAQAEEARLVFDVSNLPEHNIYTLQDPPRLIIDFKNAQLAHPLQQPSKKNEFLAKIDTGTFNDDNLRVVIELKKNIAFKYFSLPSNKTHGERVVVDLAADSLASLVETVSHTSTPEPTKSTKANIEPPKPAAVNQASVSAPVKEVINATPPANKTSKTEPAISDPVKSNPAPATPEASVASAKAEETSKPVAYLPKSKGKKFVIAIDAGHGGEDPGAHGIEGTEEKRVVLAIAEKLEAFLADQPGFKPVMVRKGDRFIKLRKRMDIARAAKADLLISIHADAFNDASVQGSSIYTLSSNGASSEAARWLADNENAADLVGGVSLDDKDDMLASVLLDLSQTATTEASSKVASKILGSLKQVASIHKASVQKAAFLVLKAPDIPSILVETGFISNPSEEAKLRNPQYQEKIANALGKGIIAYFKQRSPVIASTRIAKVIPGEPHS